jgi:hypothetical protein
MTANGRSALYGFEGGSVALVEIVGVQTGDRRSFEQPALFASRERQPASGGAKSPDNVGRQGFNAMAEMRTRSTTASSTVGFERG